MKALIKTCLIFPLLLIGWNAVAQNQGLAAIDSMKLLLKNHRILDSAKVTIIYRISDAYRNIDTDSAMSYAEGGLASAKKINWSRGIAAFYDHMGSLYNNNGSYEKAIQYYHASLEINRNIRNKRAEAANIINIGSVYQRQGDDVKALEHSFKALKITQEIEDKGYTALLFGNISDVYFSQENYAMALSYSFKAYREYEQLEDLSGLARSADRIGSVYLATEKPGEADRYFQQSLKIYKETDDKMGQAKTLSHIALLHESNAGRKLEYLAKAQQLFDETNPLHPNSITNLGNIGTTYARNFFSTKDRGAAQKAALYLKKAVDASKQVGDRDNLGSFLAELALLQEKNEQYKDALLNYKRSKEITDSLFSQDSKNKIASLEAEYAFQKKEETYKQQQQLSKLKFRQLYLYGALIILLISLTLIYLLNRSRIRHLRLKNEMHRKQTEEKNRELINRYKLSESELKAIRAQMNPHFIFNVLNSIESYIVENDAKTASRLVQKFASLSRLILENSTQSMVSADREWKALMLYAELEVMRFNKQFNCSFYTDPAIDLSRLLLPPMLVQPLIENAIHHGMRNSTAEDNAVTVTLEQTENTLVFTVEDNGIGMDKAEKFKTFSFIKSKSIGISSIKERIEIFNVMNPEQLALFELRDKIIAEGSGTIAKLTLPKIYRHI